MEKEYKWLWYNRTYVLCHYDNLYREVYVEVTPCYSNPNAEYSTLYFMGKKYEFECYNDAIAKGEELFIIKTKRNSRIKKINSINKEETSLDIIKNSLPLSKNMILIISGLLIGYFVGYIILN